jgi:hypothetical protein
VSESTVYAGRSFLDGAAIGVKLTPAGRDPAFAA